jgi:hypothetical protein
MSEPATAPGVHRTVSASRAASTRPAKPLPPLSIGVGHALELAPESPECAATLRVWNGSCTAPVWNDAQLGVDTAKARLLEAVHEAARRYFFDSSPKQARVRDDFVAAAAQFEEAARMLDTLPVAALPADSRAAFKKEMDDTVDLLLDFARASCLAAAEATTQLIAPRSSRSTDRFGAYHLSRRDALVPGLLPTVQDLFADSSEAARNEVVGALCAAICDDGEPWSEGAVKNIRWRIDRLFHDAK